MLFYKYVSNLLIFFQNLCKVVMPKYIIRAGKLNIFQNVPSRMRTSYEFETI